MLNFKTTLLATLLALQAQAQQTSCGENGMESCTPGGMASKYALSTTYGPLTASGMAATPIYSVNYWSYFDGSCSASVGGKSYTGSACTDFIVQYMTLQATLGVYQNQNTAVNIFAANSNGPVWQYFLENRGQGPSNDLTADQGYYCNGQTCGPWRGSFLTGADRMTVGSDARRGIKVQCKNSLGATGLSQTNFNGLTAQIIAGMRSNVSAWARFAVYRQDKTVIARCRIDMGMGGMDTCPDQLFGSNNYTGTPFDTPCNPCNERSP
ncbi:hypothetical protein B9Z65_4969 [Elsinoe australis]|uniref:Uncharacterized protein n=1 Tax=Elsinoe australis TaxID=40998 RepID=A0A2P7ZCT6_9PEZI|nr:hypothetical protein B9Z65_4969 [Elsinoe australis]